MPYEKYYNKIDFENLNFNIEFYGKYSRYQGNINAVGLLCNKV